MKKPKLMVYAEKRKTTSKLIAELLGPNRGKNKFLIMAQDATTQPKSSLFIRLLLPLSSLKSHRIVVTDRVPLLGIRNYDAVIVQRTVLDTLDKAKELVDRLAGSKNLLILDSDDAFIAIDDKHPEYQQQLSRVEAMNFIANNADLITVSTEELKKSFIKINPSVVVIPNTIDDSLWNLKIKYDFNHLDEPLHFIYMGTATHDADFKMIFPALEKLQRDYPNSFDLTVIGVSREIPDRTWITRKVQPKNGALYPNFVHWFQTLGPFDVGLAPLVDSKFNAAKSDIKCLDYLAASILPVVSELKPYETKGLTGKIIRTGNTDREWYKVLEKLLRDPNEARKLIAIKVAEGKNYILQKRLSKVAGEKLSSEIEKRI